MMTEHLKLAGRPHAEQAAALTRFVRETPVLVEVLRTARADGLPQALIVAGALYNLTWNRLTGRPALAGVNDIDLVYFDPDLSWDAEDRVIRRLGAQFANLPVPVEIRNQARVHLWFPPKIGIATFAPLRSSADMLPFYAARAFAVAVGLDRDDALRLVAPFGLDDLFSFQLAPNPALPNRVSYEKKCARAQSFWPELTILPWID